MLRPRLVHRDGTTWMVGLLVLSLAVLVALAWQAYDAARGHRDAAQDVLRDYARLAADEVAARCLQGVGYYGAFPALQQLVLLSERSHQPGLAGPADIARTGDRQIRQAIAIFSTSLRLDRGSGRLETAGAPLPAEVAAWLVGRLSDETVSRAAGRPMTSLYTVIDSVEHRAFVVPVDDDASPIYGLLLDPRAAGARLGQSLEAVALLPQSLAGEELGSDAVAIELIDAAGTVVFATEETPQQDPYTFAPVVTHRFGDDYSGLLEGWTARVGLDAEAAPMLVIGGLPRSRLPMLAGLIAVGALLLVAALAQLQRARRLTRLRADFIAEVSHELRTPLTQIRMFTETLLLGRVRSEAESRRSLEIVDREARRLGRLVENILQFARQERSTIALERQEQPVAPIIRAVLDEMAPMAAASDIRIEADLDSGAVAAVDASALQQIMLNLLDNAFKYGPTGQTVRVALRVEDGLCRVTIEDEGPGVPKAERKRIWKSYRRLERDRRAAIAGTGIGLAVVRDLVERHGGRAWVAAGSNGGARFELTLPAAAGSPASSAADGSAVEVAT